LVNVKIRPEFPLPQDITAKKDFVRFLLGLSKKYTAADRSL
jgi:hypothetical protein